MNFAWIFMKFTWILWKLAGILMNFASRRIDFELSDTSASHDQQVHWELSVLSDHVTQILMICESAGKKTQKWYFQFDRSRRSEGVGSSYLDMLLMLFKILIYFGKKCFLEIFRLENLFWGNYFFDFLKILIFPSENQNFHWNFDFRKNPKNPFSKNKFPRKIFFPK